MEAASDQVTIHYVIHSKEILKHGTRIFFLLEDTLNDYYLIFGVNNHGANYGLWNKPVCMSHKNIKP